MRAVAYRHCLPVTDPDCLFDVELPEPALGARDLLVRVRAVSVNPVDTKLRRNADTQGQLRVLGFDAAGDVLAVGSAVTRFKVGDSVFYAGALDRPGCHAGQHAVDERLVGHKPATLSYEEAAAVPLTAVTAWELLFDRLAFPVGQVSKPGAVLIVGAAGGVGSIAVQLARRLTGLTVIATASRPETRDWVWLQGAHHVINHHHDLVEQTLAIVPGGVDAVLALTATDQHFPSYSALIKPQGRIALIDDPQQPLDILSLKRKSISLHWELMFTRSLFQTEDMGQQGHLLDEVSRLLDAGLLRSTLTQELGELNAVNLRRAHALLESGASMGKVVLTVA